MTIITGIGRSGTSLLAFWLRECGVPIVGYWLWDREAGMEDPRVGEINDGLDEGMSDDEALAKIRALNFIVAKDPRLTRRASRKLRLWKMGQPGIRVVLTHRDPAQAWASRETHELHYWQSPLQAQLAFAETVMALDANEIPWTLLTFPTFLDRFDAVYAAFAGDVGLILPTREQALATWNSVVDRSLVHRYEEPYVTVPVPMQDTGGAWRESDFLWPQEQRHALP